jgi:ribosome-interacting GTPase 1
VRKNETHIEVSHDRTTGRFVIAVVRGADWVFIRDEPILVDALQIAQRAANSLGIRVTEKTN